MLNVLLAKIKKKRISPIKVYQSIKHYSVIKIDSAEPRSTTDSPVSPSVLYYCTGTIHRQFKRQEALRQRFSTVCFNWLYFSKSPVDGMHLVIQLWESSHCVFLLTLSLPVYPSESP